MHAVDVALAFIEVPEEIVEEVHVQRPAAISSSPTCSRMSAGARVTWARLRRMPPLALTQRVRECAG